MRILVLGVTGMLGNTLFKSLSSNNAFDVYGTARHTPSSHLFPEQQAKLITEIHAENPQSFIQAFMQAKPDVVINCIGIIKQLPQAKEPLKTIAINAYLPHQLSELCQLMQCRLIHISTDCVFSGEKGNYVEDDPPDATDLYGRSKLLGEVHDKHAITLRTSIIGHELTTHKSLVNWFLAQKDHALGYEKAIFLDCPRLNLLILLKNLL